MGHLYMLTFENGKAYIGISSVSAHVRFRKHKSDSSHAKTLVYRAWRKYGEPEMTVLAVVANEDLAATEVRAISAFGTFGSGGYNMTIGGDLPPTLNPEIARHPDRLRKLSLAHKGRVHSPATRFANAERMFEHFSNPEERLRQSARMVGKRHSDDTLKKMSDSQSKRYLSQSAREKQSVIANKLWANPEFRMKVSIAHSVRCITKPMSDMTKALNAITLRLSTGN